MIVGDYERMSDVSGAYVELIGNRTEKTNFMRRPAKHGFFEINLYNVYK